MRIDENWLCILGIGCDTERPWCHLESCAWPSSDVVVGNRLLFQCCIEYDPPRFEVAWSEAPLPAASSGGVVGEDHTEEGRIHGK